MRQLNICEQLGIMIFLNERGRICVFKLSEFNSILNDNNSEQGHSKSRAHFKEHKLDSVQGCSVYALRKNQMTRNGIFKIVAACGKKLLVLETKCTGSNIVSEASSIYENKNSLISPDSNTNVVSVNYETEAQNFTSFHVKKVIKFF